jgi:hypothetical protein
MRVVFSFSFTGAFHRVQKECSRLQNFTRENILYVEDLSLIQLVAVKAMLHGATFLATCNAILLLRDVN